MKARIECDLNKAVKRKPFPLCITFPSKILEKAQSFKGYRQRERLRNKYQ